MIPGYVMFRLAQQTFALSLDQTREIVRLNGLERLPGHASADGGDHRAARQPAAGPRPARRRRGGRRG